MSGPSISEFADKINEIMPFIARELIKYHPGGFYKSKVTLPQLFVMDMLYRRGESKMTDLSRFMNVTTAAMTGIIDRMVRDGYVERTSDPEDRRIVRAHLTKKGSAIVRDAAEQKKKMTIRIFGMISQAEREEYLKILQHIQRHLKEQENQGP